MKKIKILRYFTDLKRIRSVKNREKLKRIIAGMSSDILKCFQECAVNLLQQNVPVEPREFSNLKKNQSSIRKLGKRSKLSNNKIRRILLQDPSLLRFLLDPVLRMFDEIV